MKKSLLVGIILVGVFLFVISFFGKSIFFIPLYVFEITRINSGQSVTNKAIQTNNPELCKNVPSTYDGATSPTRCYNLVATTNNNENACSYLTYGESQKRCLEQIGNNYQKIALTNKDKSYCGRISDQSQKEGCFEQYAYLTGDVDACNQFTVKSNLNYCLARVNKTISYCKNLTDQDRLHPYNTWNSSIIVSGVYFNHPSDACTFDVAVIQGNTQMCSQISSNNSFNYVNTCKYYAKRDVVGYCKENGGSFPAENCQQFAQDVVNTVQNLKY